MGAREVSIIGAIPPRRPTDKNVYSWWTKLRIAPLITHVEKPENGLGVYTMLADAPGQALGVLFEW